MTIFQKDADFAAFERVLIEAHKRIPLRILGYVLMSNHWHFVVWPARREHEQVSNFFHWLTVTHTQRWHTHYATTGTGHLYQGRFKSFPIAADESLLAVLRYVERNPLRAGLVARAETWRWGSLYRRTHGTAEERALLAESPVPLAADWTARVNAPQTELELASLRRSVARNQPYGCESWRTKVIQQLGLEHTVRPRGRPKTRGA